MKEKRDSFSSWRIRVLVYGFVGSLFLIGFVHTVGVYYRVFK